MPFAGYENFEACVRANSDKSDPEAYCATIQREVEGKLLSRQEVLDLVSKQNDPARICGDLWFNGTSEQRASFGNGTEGRGRDEAPPEAWWNDCTSTVSQSAETDASDAVEAKSATLAGGFDTIGAVPKQDTTLDEDVVQEALEADEFIVYGKASIEQVDDDGELLEMDALEAALDRFFDSEKAPGIISRAHADVPVGQPVREHTLDDDVAIELGGGETHEFDAGETIRTHVQDADGDDRPELWLVADLAKDTDIAKETRLGALTGELNGFSVTVKKRDVEGGGRVTDLDLHAVTIGSGEQIKNEGSEFDVAEFKALFASATGADDAAITTVAEDLGETLSDKLMSDNESKTEQGLLGRLLKQAGEELEEDAQTDEKADDEEPDEEEEGAVDDEEGKQDTDVTDLQDLAEAMADLMDVPVSDVMSALDEIQQDGDADLDEKSDLEVTAMVKEKLDAEAGASPDEDPADEKTDGGDEDDAEYVTEDELESKLDEHRAAIVDDLAPKLEESVGSAVEELAQKGQTPSPTGGSTADAVDFDSQLEEAAEGDAW